MPKVTYDVSGVEDSGGGDEAPVAVYPMQIMVAEQRTNKANGDPTKDIHIALKILGDVNYRWLHFYVDPAADGQKWKWKQLTDALGLPAKGSVDLDKQIKGQKVRGKVNAGTSNDEAKTYRAEMGTVMRFGDDDDAAEPDAPEQPDTPDAEAADGFVASRELVDGIGSYDEWPDGDLEGETQDRGLTIPGGRGAKRAKYITALRADDEAAGGSTPEAEDESEAAPEPAGEDDYDTWDVNQLTQECKDRALSDLPAKEKGAGAGAKFKAALVERLRADDNSDPFENEES